MSEAGSGTKSGGGRLLAILLLAYILNFLDRQILGILAQPIKADLHLSDSQFGAIGGLAFAILYSVLAHSAGADRRPDAPERRRGRRSGRLERLHGSVRRSARLSANCSCFASASG